MYAEIIEKRHASNMKLFTYPSNIKVFTSLSNNGIVNYFYKIFPTNLFSLEPSLLSTKGLASLQLKLIVTKNEHQR